MATDNIIQNTNFSGHASTSDKGGFYISGNTYVEAIDNTVYDTAATTPYGFRIVGGTNEVYLKGNKTIGTITTADLSSSGTQSYLKLEDNKFSGTVSLGTVTTIEGRNNVGIDPDIIYAQGNITGATTFTRVSGRTITATLTGNVTTTITNGVIKGDLLTLILTQDGTGSRTISKPTNVKLVGGAFSPTATASATDIWDLVWNGTHWVEVSRSLNVS